VNKASKDDPAFDCLTKVKHTVYFFKAVSRLGLHVVFTRLVQPVLGAKCVLT